jgi:hypothetical protein
MERDKEKRVHLERRKKRAKKRSYGEEIPTFTKKRSNNNGRKPDYDT